jgi:hypothetical protein
VRASVRSSFEFLSMSTLDLFASMLGTFVLITFVLLPYYLREPSLEADIRQAEAEVSQTEDALRLAREKLVAAHATREKAEALLATAWQRLVVAQTPVPQPVAAPNPPEATRIRKPGAIAIPDLDLAIVIDTTGSMRREIRDLQSGLLGVIRILHRLSSSLAVSVIAYRDNGEAYVTRTFPLSRIDDGTLRGLLDFVSELRAEGGGDPPEAVDVALAEASRIAWRDRVLGRIIVIGDAPPHAQDWQRSFETITRFHASDRGNPGRTVGAIFTGRDPNGRAFFERMAQAGSGDFRENKGELMESILLSVLKDTRKE